MKRSSWFSLIILTFPFCVAFVFAADSERLVGHGKGWVEFRLLPESPDREFIRNFVEQSEDYRVSQSLDRLPWDINELRVGYHDFNDDGTPEMILSFAEVSSHYCGTGGCDMYFFQMRSGKWQKMFVDSMFSIWVSDEKIMGYRTLYTQRGTRMYWNGRGYSSECIETLPIEIRPEHEIYCENG